jgi:hypothetical protein
MPYFLSAPSGSEAIFPLLKIIGTAKLTTTPITRIPKTAPIMMPTDFVPELAGTNCLSILLEGISLPVLV